MTMGTAEHLRAAKKLLLVVGIVTAVIAGPSGCSSKGDALPDRSTTEESLELQRISAQKFKSNWPQTESITFTHEGRNNDESGQWVASAIVTISSQTYEEIIGPWMTGGDPLPDPAPPGFASPVTVHFSNGTSEVLP